MPTEIGGGTSQKSKIELLVVENPPFMFSCDIALKTLRSLTAFNGDKTKNHGQNKIQDFFEQAN